MGAYRTQQASLLHGGQKGLERWQWKHGAILGAEAWQDMGLKGNGLKGTRGKKSEARKPNHPGPSLGRDPASEDEVLL